MDGQFIYPPLGNNGVNLQTQLNEKALKMSTWLTVLGYTSIVVAILSIVATIGIPVAWVFIWLGVVLIQAANKAKAAHATNDASLLLEMMDRLYLYFVISATIIVFSMIFIVVFISYLLNVLAGNAGTISDLIHLYL